MPSSEDFLASSRKVDLNELVDHNQWHLTFNQGNVTMVYFRWIRFCLRKTEWDEDHFSFPRRIFLKNPLEIWKKWPLFCHSWYLVRHLDLSPNDLLIKWVVKIHPWSEPNTICFSLCNLCTNHDHFEVSLGLMELWHDTKSSQKSSEIVSWLIFLKKRNKLFFGNRP